MSADSELWTELKGFDRCEPSALAFRALIALLDVWPSVGQASAIEYAEKSLSTWPDATRIAPWSWCKAASNGTVSPTWRLVRALQLTPDHLAKGSVDLARLARHADLSQITELEIPRYSKHQELSFLYHRPNTLPKLKRLRAADNRDDGDVRALAQSPLWRTLEAFEVGVVTESLTHQDASRIVPHVSRPSAIRHVTLRSPDLIALLESNELPELQSASVFVRSIDEAMQLAKRDELSRLTSLSIAFRCGFSGSSPFEPFLGNVIEADEAASDAFFRRARLDRLEKLAIVGYSMGYWGREGMGRLGLDALIDSGLLKRVTHLRLHLLPLGDKGIASLAPALGAQLQALELVDVYCKGAGARALGKSPCMRSLKTLDLSGNRIDSKSFAQMARVEMPRLQRLDLSGPKINPYYWNVGQQPLLDAGAAAWAKSANVKHLRQLRMRNCHLTDKGLTAIFRSTQLGNLEQLDLSDNSFTATAISQAVVGSHLWERLEELGLNHCRLDNQAVEALTQVREAQALRSIHLEYNSIGPKGAAALANWPVLARVWQLGLHDNFIGDEGLIALAQSPYLGRLLELDFEQDCWNSRTFTFNDKAAQALAESKSFSRLDSLFSGCVDEYHGTAYSPGFSKDGLNALRKSPSMRPAFKASCSDFTGVSEYLDRSEFDEEVELSEGDFRQHPMTLNEKEAESGERRMQQVRASTAVQPAFDFDTPPKIRQSLSELETLEDIIEGLEYRDPVPVIDLRLNLSLSHEDRERPLPNQAGKFIVDTLGSVFKACSFGSFDTSSSTSRNGDDGRTIHMESGFSVGIKGDPEAPVQLIRETLWWIGAPGKTKLDQIRLGLNKKPRSTASRFLQLAALKVSRWKFGGEPGHRIDRVAFSTSQRDTAQRILKEAGALEPKKGWATVSTTDSGSAQLFVKYLSDSSDFDALNVLVDKLTPEMSRLIYRFMDECGLMLLPMAFATTPDVARTIDCDWPRVEIVASATQLHEHLASGPYHWWKRDLTW